MSIRVIATDIDLTLIDERGILPPTNIQALQLAAHANIRIVLATARRREPAQEVLDRLQIPATLICHNGARLWDDQGRELAHLTIDLPIAQELAALADQRGIPLVFTIDEVNYFNPATLTATMPPTPSMRLDTVHVPSLAAAITQPPTRILVHSLHAITMLKEWIKAYPSIRMFQYAKGSGEVFSAIIAHPQATKENALAALCERWGVASSEVLSIGDAEADAGMLRWAGVGVAVKGSMQPAIDAADWIAPSARFGGVAVAIHRYALV